MINQGYDGGERLVDNKEEGEVVEKVFMSEKNEHSIYKPQRPHAMHTILSPCKIA